MLRNSAQMRLTRMGGKTIINTVILENDNPPLYTQYNASEVRFV